MDALTRAATELQRANPHLGAQEAYRRALEADPDLARAHHRGEGDQAPPAPAAAAEPTHDDPGAALMRLMGAKVAAGCSHEEARRQAFAEFPRLADAYTRGMMIPRAPAAIEHFRATLTIHEQQLAGTTIRNVEVFSTGSWNGKTYTVRDLDDMVDAFHRIGFVPPVKLGHGDENELAHGFVSRLWRVGDKLLADFSNVPPETVALIRAGRLMTVSAEVYLDLDRGGQRWRRALRAVALLGSNPPGVSNLRPLAELLPAA